MSSTALRIEELTENAHAPNSQLRLAITLIQNGTSFEMAMRSLSLSPGHVRQFMRRNKRHDFTIEVRRAESMAFATAEQLVLAKSPEKYLKARRDRYEALGGSGNWGDENSVPVQQNQFFISEGVFVGDLAGMIQSGQSNESKRGEIEGQFLGVHDVAGDETKTIEGRSHRILPSLPAPQSIESEGRPRRSHTPSAGGSSFMEGIDALLAGRPTMDDSSADSRQEHGMDAMRSSRPIGSMAGSVVDNRDVLYVPADNPSYTSRTNDAPPSPYEYPTTISDISYDTSSIIYETPTTPALEPLPQEVETAGLDNPPPIQPSDDLYLDLDDESDAHTPRQYEELVTLDVVDLPARRSPEVGEELAEERVGGSSVSGRRSVDERSESIRLRTKSEGSSATPAALGASPPSRRADKASSPAGESLGASRSTRSDRIVRSIQERTPPKEPLHPVFDDPGVNPYPGLTEEEIEQIPLSERTTLQVVKEEYLSKALCPKCGKPGYKRLTRGRTFCAYCDIAPMGVGETSTLSREIHVEPDDPHRRYKEEAEAVERKKPPTRIKAGKKAQPKH